MDLDSTWTVTRTDPSSRAVADSNTIFTISNGYMAFKGNLAEDRSGSHASTFINGVFDLADMMAFIRPTKHERRYLDPEFFDGATPSPSVANLPNPMFVRVFVDGREISFTEGSVSGFAQTCDLRNGVYMYCFDHEAPDGRRTRIHMERACDMINFHRACMQYTITPLNYAGILTLQSGINGRVRSNLQNDRQFAVVAAGCSDGGRCSLVVRTLDRQIDVRLLTADVLKAGAVSTECFIEHEAVYRSYRLEVSPGRPVTLEKFVVLGSSEDVRHGVVCDEHRELDSALSDGVEGIFRSNLNWWRDVWERIDVRIEGDDTAQLYLRFCLFHLMSAAPRHTDRLSVPCKLLTGEHYQGTTFYDTDLYTVDFYTFTYPEIARACLNFRYLGLEPGRQIARELGFDGAKFAWQAGPYGEEALGKWWRFTRTNIHINGDVAYSLMRYWRVSGDEAFLLERGVDILVESARFYVSRAEYDPENDRWDLNDVAGPDEGHCESKNNFYTNLLAARTLSWAAETLNLMQIRFPEDYARTRARLNLTDEEPKRWLEVAGSLTFYFDPRTKIYEQCEGFYQLAPAPPDLLEGRTEWFVTVFPYQALNQPDVVMGLVLFSDEFDEEVRRANWDFYRDKSMNFSSMSYVINSLMAKDAGDLDYAYRQFLISAGEDLDTTLTGRGDTADGIHGTASAGAWMAAVHGFGGVWLGSSGLSVSPRLPVHWKSLAFNLVIQGELIRFEIDHSRVRIITGEKCNFVMPAFVCGRRLSLRSGEVLEVPISGLHSNSELPEKEIRRQDAQE